jgi:hypothetical protein
MASGQAIGIRADSRFTAPEPELALGACRNEMDSFSGRRRLTGQPCVDFTT